MKLLLSGVEGLEPALREAIPGLDIGHLDASDPDAARASLDDAAALVLSQRAFDDLLAAGIETDLPVLCAVDPATPPVELRRLTGRGVRRLMFEPVDPVEVVREIRRITGTVAPSQAGGSASDASGLGAGIAAVWAEFRGTMMERVDVLESVGSSLVAGTRDPSALAAARTAAHKLHGSLGTFGNARGSELAAEIEGLLIRGVPAQGDVFRYTELVVALRRSLEEERGPVDATASAGGPAAAAGPARSPATGPARDAAAAAGEASTPEAGARRRRGRPERPAPGQPVHLMIAETEPDRAESLTGAAMARGWRPTVVAGLDALMDAVKRDPPDVLVLDPTLGEPDRLDGWLRRLALYPPRVPVVFWSDEGDLPGRLRASAVGVRAFVERDRGAASVLDRAAGLIEEPGGGLTVLVVDDDPAIVAMAGAALSDDRIRVVGLTDPLGFWEAVEAVSPDLLVLDMDMPQVSGLQLCRTVRASARWAHLPIVFFTARADPEAVTHAMRAGGDDYVIKPVVAAELRARVLARLHRLQTPSGAGGGPVAPGVTDRARAAELARTSLAIARRHDDPVTVAMVRVRGQDPDDDVHVPLSRVAGALREAARPEDVVARWSADALVACLYGMGPDAAAAWLDERVRPHPDDRWSARIGTAGFPEDGASFGELVERAAERAGERAGHRAGDGDVAVEPASDGGAGAGVSSGDLESGAGAAGTPGRAGASTERVDVVLVEDDEALATLLAHTFAARDLTTRWLRDGVEADRLLTGRRPALAGRVILLDIGLPGLDGLTVLRRLADSGVTARSRVVMLTARSGEAEVLRALEMGAYDHVPKPFSVAELLHRVRRALEAGGRRP